METLNGAIDDINGVLDEQIVMNKCLPLVETSAE